MKSLNPIQAGVFWRIISRGGGTKHPPNCKISKNAGIDTKLGRIIHTHVKFQLIQKNLSRDQFFDDVSTFIFRFLIILVKMCYIFEASYLLMMNRFLNSVLIFWKPIEFSFDNIQSNFQYFQVLTLYSAPKLSKLIFSKLARHYENMTSSEKNFFEMLCLVHTRLLSKFQVHSITVSKVISIWNLQWNTAFCTEKIGSNFNLLT